tara:strand:- start:216 stop:464 length:249 start_codon:yes stop_codon:yes gene_type:complete
MEQTRKQQRINLDQNAILIEKNWYEDENGNSIRIFDGSDGLEEGTFRVVDTATGFESRVFYSKMEASKELKYYIKNNFLKVI